METTTKREMLERIYGTDLQADIGAWVADGKSWYAISDLIVEACGVRINRVSLAAWYGSDVAA